MDALLSQQQAVELRVLQTTAAHPDWPCRKGCDDCCRSLAAVPTVTRAEWDLVNAAIKGGQRVIKPRFGVDEDVCTRCALCVDRCPTGIIVLGKIAAPGTAGDPHARTPRHGYAYGVRF